jgi:hypothetical protein
VTVARPLDTHEQKPEDARSDAPCRWPVGNWHPE